MDVEGKSGVEVQTPVRKRKLEEILDSEDEGGDDEDYGWAEGDENDWPPPPPQTQGSEDILVVPAEEDEETEEGQELQEDAREDDQETDDEYDDLLPSERIRRKERHGREITQADIEAYAEETMWDFDPEIPDV
jgi:hypothetical protein